MCSFRRTVLTFVLWCGPRPIFEKLNKIFNITLHFVLMKVKARLSLTFTCEHGVSWNCLCRPIHFVPHQSMFTNIYVSNNDLKKQLFLFTPGQPFVMRSHYWGRGLMSTRMRQIWRKQSDFFNRERKNYGKNSIHSRTYVSSLRNVTRAASENKQLVFCCGLQGLNF